MLAQALQVIGRKVVVERGQRGFGEHDHLGARREHHGAVLLEGALAHVFAPFHLLRDVSLQQRNRQWAPGGLGPGNRAAQGAGEEERRQPGHERVARARPRRARHDPRECRRREPDGKRGPVGAGKRGIPRERARGRLRGSDREPRKAGEERAAQPLEGDECRCRREKATRDRSCAEAHRGIARERGEERQVGAEEECRERGEHHGHRAEVMQAHEDPRDSGEEKPEAEGESGERGLERRAAPRPDVEEHGERHGRHGPRVERREGEHARASGEQRQQQPERDDPCRRRRRRRVHREPHLGSFCFGLSTRREWILRLSARRTWKV